MIKRIFLLNLLCFIIFISLSASNVNLSKSFIKFDSKKPINISSKYLEILETKKGILKFHYKTNVVTIQGDNKVYSDELIAIYLKKQKKLQKITFKGNVKIKSKTTICSCNQAIYDIFNDKIYLIGNIKIFQDKNLLNGDEMIIDLKTNSTILKGTSKRINTIFNTGGNVKSK